MLKKIIKNKRGGTVLFMTMMLLFGILTVTLAVSDIVQNIMKVGRSQADSTLALFAAEAGAERILHEIRVGTGDPPDTISPGTDCPNTAKFCFDTNGDYAECAMSCSGSNIATTTLSNGAQYYILYKNEELAGNSTTTLSCVGQYREMRRKVDLVY